MTTILIISVIIIIIILLLSVLTINKGYGFQHTIDPEPDSPDAAKTGNDGEKKAKPQE